MALGGLPALACGDKFLLLGRSLRYEEAYAAKHPASVLLYSIPRRALRPSIPKSSSSSRKRRQARAGGQRGRARRGFEEHDFRRDLRGRCRPRAVSRVGAADSHAVVLAVIYAPSATEKRPPRRNTAASSRRRGRTGTSSPSSTRSCGSGRRAASRTARRREVPRAGRPSWSPARMGRGASGRRPGLGFAERRGVRRLGYLYSGADWHLNARGKTGERWKHVLEHPRSLGRLRADRAPRDLGRISYVWTRWDRDGCYGLTVLPFRPHGPHDDDEKWHGSLQDARFEARYNLLEEPLLVTPLAGIVFPTHDYVTAGHAATGRLSSRRRWGSTSGGQWTPPHGRWTQVRFAYSFVENIKDHDTGDVLNLNRSNLDAESGSTFRLPSACVFSAPSSGQSAASTSASPTIPFPKRISTITTGGLARTFRSSASGPPTRPGRSTSR